MAVAASPGTKRILARPVRRARSLAAATRSGDRSRPRASPVLPTAAAILLVVQPPPHPLSTTLSPAAYAARASSASPIGPILLSKRSSWPDPRAPALPAPLSPAQTGNAACRVRGG